MLSIQLTLVQIHRGALEPSLNVGQKAVSTAGCANEDIMSLGLRRSRKPQKLVRLFVLTI